MYYGSFPSPMAFDMALMEPVHYMMQRGIRIDPKLLEAYKEERLEEFGELQRKLNVVAGRDLNVNSPKQMKEVLYDHLGLPTRVKGGKPTVNEDALRSLTALALTKSRESVREATITRYQRGYVICTLALKIRGIRKELSSYLEIDFDTDSRARCTMSIGGTKTFRFSHSKTLWDTGLNLATVPRKLRKMFIADEGKEMAEFDLNRGESWIYAHLSEDPELLRIHLEGLDFHAETASAISIAFGEPLTVEWIVENKEGEAYKIRYLGKKVNHASAYRMGPYRGAQIINQEADETGITVSIPEVREAQRLWRWKYSNMERWWSSIEDQLGRDRTMTTPWGRKRQFFDFWGESLFKDATAYVPQSTSVDYMNLGMLRVFNELVKREAFGLELLHQNHDSILVQYDEGRRDEVFPAINELLFSELTIHGRTFSIPTEGAYGQNWLDLTEHAA